MSSRKEKDDPWLAYVSRTADRGPRPVLPPAYTSGLAAMKAGPLPEGDRVPDQQAQLDLPDAARPGTEQAQVPRAPRESDGWQILSYMLGGMLLYGGVGWLVSHWTGISIIFPLGMILGIGLSVAMIIFRFTRS
jgi:ATP synthase protein I